MQTLHLGNTVENRYSLGISILLLHDSHWGEKTAVVKHEGNATVIDSPTYPATDRNKPSKVGDNKKAVDPSTSSTISPLVRETSYIKRWLARISYQSATNLTLR